MVMLNSVIIPILFILDHTTRISENSRNMPADRKKRRGRPPKETSPGKSYFSKRVQNYNLKAAWKLIFQSLSFDN